MPLHSNRTRPRIAVEQLEDRSVPVVARASVATTWELEADSDASNTVSLGDAVSNYPHGRVADAVRGTYGVDAFGTVIQAFAGYTGTLGADPAFDGIADALAGTADGGTVMLLGNVLYPTGAGTYTEAVDLGQGGGVGKTLAGCAVIDGPVNIPAGGTLSPGNPTNPITTGTLTLQNGATLRYQISPFFTGGIPERVVVTGDVNLNGATLDHSGGPDAGNTCVVIDNQGTNPVSGTFAGLPNGALVTTGGLVGVIRYDGGDGNDVVLDFTDALGSFRTRGQLSDPFAPAVRPGQGIAGRPFPGISSIQIPEPLSAGETVFYRFLAPLSGVYQFRLQPTLRLLDGRFTVRDEPSGTALLGPVDTFGVGVGERGSVYLRGGEIYRVELAAAAGVDETYSLEVVVNRSNIGAFDNGVFYLDTNASYKYEPGVDAVYPFGLPGDQPVAGSWGGSTDDRIGVYRNGLWLLDANGNGKWDGNGPDAEAHFGGDPADRAVAGDFDGDARDEIGVFRAGTWLIDLNHSGAWDAGDAEFTFGQAGDQPVVGDWDGDGVADLGVRRGLVTHLDSDGDRAWSAGDTQVQRSDWALPAPPVAGDWQGLGHDQLGVYEDTLYKIDAPAPFPYPTNRANYGAPGSLPVVGQWADPVGWPPVLDPNSRTLAVAGPGAVAAVYRADAAGRYGPTPVATLEPFPELFAIPKYIRTAAGDVNGDHVEDTVVVTGPGTAIRVAVLSGADDATFLVAPFDPFGGGFTGGGFVAVADLDHDGRAEFVVTPDQGGGPRVAVFALAADGTVSSRASFLGIDDPAFRGGCRAAVGDVNADGRPDLVAAAGFLGGPRVALFDGRSLFGSPTRLTGDFFAFPGADAETLRNGAFAAAGDVDGDGYADLVFGGGPGGAPRVFVLSGRLLAVGNTAGAFATPVANFFVAGNADDRGGVRVAVKNADGDLRADLVVGTGQGGPSRVKVYLGDDLTDKGEPAEFEDLDPFGWLTTTDGVFVG